MKYTNQVTINKPLNEVVDKFDNLDNMFKWMPGLVSFEPISGTPGEVGAKARMKFKMGNREIEMIETITVKNLPHEYSGTYDANGVYNIVKNYFSAVDAKTTLYKSENEFQFKGFMKLIALLMPGAFKKQSQVYLDKFKEFAEK